MKNIQRLKYLKTMLVKYSHRLYETNGELSPRMYSWLDEYDGLKENFPSDWIIHCEQTRSSVNHGGRDLFA